MRNYHKDGTLPDGPAIWVFGSNLAGRNGAGAALVAARKFGAKYGVGEGLTGRAYAIPTKDAQLRVIQRAEIARNVKEFLDVARAMPDQDFFVTRVGCGLAGYRDSSIAPLFAEAPENCSLPEEWRDFLA